MKFKPNYAFIPLIVILAALVGSWFSSQGMAWYDSELVKPALTPPKLAFPIAWNTIFICTTISALIFWNKSTAKKKLLTRHWWIVSLFVANAILNVLWSFLFFQLHLVTSAYVEMLFLEASVIALILLIWKLSKTASLLLLPYALWGAFATYLTYLIITLGV
ncbi:MAG: TspO/MBR family protein [Candidatus Gracilibacteria bacterium]